MSDESESSVQLTERQTAVAEGLGLVEQGHSYRYAAREVGLSPSWLWEKHRKLLGPNAPGREERLRAQEARIEGLAAEVATRGLERMADEIDTAEHKTVTAWTSVARDTLSKKRRWERQEEQGAGAGLERALSRLGQQGDVTLTLRQRGEGESVEAEELDVTPGREAPE